MKKISKFIRIVTIAPIAAILLNLTLYFAIPDSFQNIGELLLIILFTAILPVLAYPVQKMFHLLSIEDEREAARTLAILFSIGSYTIGLILSFFLQLSYLQDLIYYTYFFSGVLMVLFNFVFHLKASGHMCGVTGPVAVLVYILGIHYLYLLGIVLIVSWASITLNRHQYKDLIIGTMIPIIAMILSMGILLI